MNHADLQIDPATRTWTGICPILPGDAGAAYPSENTCRLRPVNLFRCWQLADREACALLGGMAKSTWKRWKGGVIDHPERITDELRRRMAVLMGVHAGLRTLFDDPERGYAWVRSPNKTINGKTPLDIMMHGEVCDLIEIRDWLYATCQNW